MGMSWKQKFERGEPSVQITVKAFAGIPAGVTMLISSPREVAAEIAALPAGTSVSIAELRSRLAARHRADVTCPLTASIFLRIVAEAAWEAHLAGAPIETITPFWRAIAPTDKVAAKLSCGVSELVRLRKSEGL